MAVYFHFHDVQFQLGPKRPLKRWISNSIQDEGLVLGEINVIFCSDEHLLSMNREHLNHDYYTDIITFDYCVSPIVSGDLFISYDRVFENASEHRVAPLFETYRVIIHGVMHLCGYGDKGISEAKIMRDKEDFYLQKLIKSDKTE